MFQRNTYLLVTQNPAYTKGLVFRFPQPKNEAGFETYIILEQKQHYIVVAKAYRWEIFRTKVQNLHAKMQKKFKFLKAS